MCKWWDGATLGPGRYVYKEHLRWSTENSLVCHHAGFKFSAPSQPLGALQKQLVNADALGHVVEAQQIGIGGDLPV